MSAANYPTPFAWRVHTQGTPDTFGQKPDVFAAPLTLWGLLDSPSAGRETEGRREVSKDRATINLRNFPAVRPLDTLEDLDGGGLPWIVEAVRRGINEIICEVTR